MHVKTDSARYYLAARGANLEGQPTDTWRDFALTSISGIFGPSFGDVISLCLSIGHVTERIPFGSSIQPIYLRPAADLAQTASYLAEVTGGRFHLGLGVSHGPIHKRLGIEVGKPLADTREYVSTITLRLISLTKLASGLVVCYLVFMSWIAANISITVLNRSEMKVTMVKYLTVVHSYVFLICALVFLVKIRSFGSTPVCNPEVMVTLVSIYYVSDIDFNPL